MTVATFDVVTSLGLVQLLPIRPRCNRLLTDVQYGRLLLYVISFASTDHDLWSMLS